MEDMRTHLEKLRADAVECLSISRTTTDKAKRELFSKLAQHFEVLAAEVERAITRKLQSE
jgi:hypothetical protein